MDRRLDSLVDVKPAASGGPPDPRPAFYLEDMGCQMNRLDSELVEGRLRKAGYRRVMAPGDAHDLAAMLEFAIKHEGPASIRYPKANAVHRASFGFGTTWIVL